MRLKQILVVKETLASECRVALTPKAVAQLTKKHYRVLVETDAGLNAGFTNADYINSGAELFSLTSSGFPANTIIVRVLRPSKERELFENQYFHENTVMLGFLFPFIADDHIATWQKLRLTTLSFDLFKSLSIHDSKNAQAAMSRIAGRLAFQDALSHYRAEKPVKLTVIGTGPAATSAAFEARKNDVPVQLFGRQAYHQAELEAVGITYYALPVAEEQVDFIKSHLVDQTMVITAARTPGKKAPLLIDEESLRILPLNAVVVDLAASNGGNVAGTQCEQVITVANGISIRNVSGYPKKEPRASSEAYAQCVVSLITDRQLVITADNIQVSRSSGSNNYSASEMSDGERAIFYLIGHVLCAEKNSVMIVDEPELHVHRSIMLKLWDKLEAVRPDCSSDFVKQGGYDQIGRALRDLADEGKLIKVGYGLYAKARPNRLTGRPMLAAEGGFVAVAKEALKRLIEILRKPMTKP